MSIRMFPIMTSDYREDRAKRRANGCIAEVIQMPWAMLEPHEAQAQRNHSESLARLAERGGLGASEAIAILGDRRYQSMAPGEAEMELLGLVLKFMQGDAP